MISQNLHSDLIRTILKHTVSIVNIKKAAGGAQHLTRPLVPVTNSTTFSFFSPFQSNCLDAFYNTCTKG